jgi:hypothetical protein
MRFIQFAAWLSSLNVTQAELTDMNATSTYRFDIWRVCPDSTFRFTLTPSSQALKFTLPISLVLAGQFKCSDRR